MRVVTMIALMGLGVVAGSYYLTTISAATAPSRVVRETLKTDNIIGNYEHFFDVRAGYETRVAEITDLKAQLASAETSADRRATQTDLNGSRQMCRSLAQTYNADSEKINRAGFKASKLPETLDAKACEA